jgi:hypothetical protein
MNKKILTFIIGMVSLLGVGTYVLAGSGCGGWFEPSCPSPTQVEKSSYLGSITKIIENNPTPMLDDSLERKNVIRRAELFNKSDKISYIYLINFGNVVSYYTVKGKVSSLSSYLVPEDQVIKWNGEQCDWSNSDSCYIRQAPDIDGTYGENREGIFFFTTEGVYVEWTGDFLMSDQPLKIRGNTSLY